jgi:RNase adaptor protein for sRNA GlmZ degradation
MPGDIREKLLQHYLDSLEKLTDIRREEFLAYYEGFILLRLLQVLAAYGFRGLIQKKSHFLASIPYAIRHLNRFLESNNLPVNMPELMGALQKLTSIGRFKAIENDRSAGLTVEVQSFAYKNGYPEDLSGHGGGFVFDCRALPNPGREESMRTFNGKDEIIVTYLEEHTEVAEFLENAFDMVSQAVDSYLSRGFDRLSVSFGCTGGQHRSVYCAEHLAALLQAKYTAIRVRLSHRERSAW